MASSKGRPGPHDRKPGTTRPLCVKTTRKGDRCKRFAIKGSKLCRSHLELAEAQIAETPPSPRGSARRVRQRINGAVNPDQAQGPSPGAKDLVKAGLSTAAKRQAGEFVLDEQARAALRKIGSKPDPNLDPKRVLLDTVEAAWRQRQVWEQMLAAIPEADWAELGKTPIPGVAATSKGARIEVIQKFLLEATKTSARISKLALDAGIEDRLVKLAEEQSALIADTVRAAVIATIGYLSAQGLLTPATEAGATEAALGAAATHLRALAAGAQGPNEQGVARRVEPEIYEGIAYEVKRS